MKFSRLFKFLFKQREGAQHNAHQIDHSTHHHARVHMHDKTAPIKRDHYDEHGGLEGGESWVLSHSATTLGAVPCPGAIDGKRTLI